MIEVRTVKGRGPVIYGVEGRELPEDEVEWLAERLYSLVGDSPAAESVPLPTPSPVQLRLVEPKPEPVDPAARALNAIQRAGEMRREGVKPASIARLLCEAGVIVLRNGAPHRVWRIFRGEVRKCKTPKGAGNRGRLRLTTPDGQSICVNERDALRELRRLA